MKNMNHFEKKTYESPKMTVEELPCAVSLLCDSQGNCASDNAFDDGTPLTPRWVDLE